ncbi:MAG TPA: RNA 2',3'-cyclic phosphodiesterase [Bryobacteraceae bacterium]|nr:RNA 2',3'-cyclic phosphodiesterase [Bryobacteraceae bacterium]
MRLFTGLDLPPEVVHNLEELLERLRPKARIHWSPPANLHITTKFIGEWPEERLDELRAALEALRTRPTIPIQVHRLGFFPNPHSPRIFTCGVEAPGLEALAQDTDRATAVLGIDSEKRAFSPHLTLARIRDRVNLQPLREAIAALPSLDFGRFEASRFFLYQSRPGTGGSVYTKLAAFSLST